MIRLKKGYIVKIKTSTDVIETVDDVALKLSKIKKPDEPISREELLEINDD